MSPSTGGVSVTAYGFTRVSGDEPFREIGFLVEVEFSPREWG